MHFSKKRVIIAVLIGGIYMIIKMSDIVVSIFAILKENNLPMIIELNQVYKIISNINKTNEYIVDFSGASVLELKLDSSFNFIKETKEITLSSGVDIDAIEKKANEDIKKEMCKQQAIQKYFI